MISLLFGVRICRGYKPLKLYGTSDPLKRNTCAREETIKRLLHNEHLQTAINNSDSNRNDVAFILGKVMPRLQTARTSWHKWPAFGRTLAPEKGC